MIGDGDALYIMCSDDCDGDGEFELWEGQELKQPVQGDLPRREGSKFLMESEGGHAERFFRALASACIIDRPQRLVFARKEAIAWREVASTAASHDADPTAPTRWQFGIRTRIGWQAASTKSLPSSMPSTVHWRPSSGNITLSTPAQSFPTCLGLL